MSTENVNDNEETNEQNGAEETVQQGTDAAEETAQTEGETPVVVEEDKNDLIRVASKRIASEESGQLVVDTVVGKLVQTEIDNRVGLITRAITTQDQMQREFRKINQPNGKRYDVIEGNRVEVLSYDDATLKAIDKAQENLTKLKKAIDSALNTNSTQAYKTLKDTLDKVGGGNKQNDKSGSNQS